MPAALRTTLDFLRDLRDNNTREWFNAHRTRWDAARAAYEGVIAELIAGFDAIDDLDALTPADTMYRINRDTRFSPDKSPYKIGLGALLGKGGRKSSGRTYYLHVQPDGESFVAGGVYMPSSAALAALRRAIAEDARPLRAILAAPDFTAHFGALQGEQLKTAPKGYDAAHPDIDLLRYKQFMALHPLSDERLLADDLVPHLLALYRAMKPFVAYCHDTLERAGVHEAMGEGRR